MTPSHHLSDEWLIDYAAGTAPEPLSVLVATHLTMCPECRQNFGRLESIGGALLAAATPVAVEAASRDAVLARLDEPAPRCAAPFKPAADLVSDLPAPLRDYLPLGLDGLRWRRLNRGAAVATLECGSATPYRLLMLRVAGGGTIPRHTHCGDELVLVLKGAYVDHLGRFGPGDIAIADDTIEHRPVAEKGGECLCLGVIGAPVRFTGLFSRLINPLLRR